MTAESSQTPWRPVREYVWLDGKPVAQEEHPSATQRYTYAVHVDQIGLPRALTNSAGQTVWSATASPYGELQETTSVDPLSGRTVVTNLRLPGQYDERLLAAAGIGGLQGPYYNWNRWYLPSLGRYLELDPIAKAGGFNGRWGPDWYGYGHGNPLRFKDRFGLDANDPEEWDAEIDYLYEKTINDLAGAAAQMWLWLAEFGWSTAAPEIAGAALAPAAAAGPTIGETCAFTKTVASHLSTRPYMQSPTVIDWIMQAGKPIADPGGIPGALRWDVLGSVGGKAGIWELVYNPANNTVYHWLFRPFRPF